MRALICSSMLETVAMRGCSLASLTLADFVAGQMTASRRNRKPPDARQDARLEFLQSELKLQKV